MRVSAFVLLLVMSSAAGFGQSAGSQNPVTDVTKNMVARYSRNIIAAAEEMPADKYGFRPTPAQQSFGHILAHIAGSNFTLCSAFSGMTNPQTKVSETDPKDTIVKAVKDSFDFCNQALAKFSDSQLGEEVTLFGGRKGPKAQAVISLNIDFGDHYSALAQYLRLNGLLPPSAAGSGQAEKPGEKK